MARTLRAEAVAAATEAGVTRLLTVGCTVPDSRSRPSEIADRFDRGVGDGRGAPARRKGRYSTGWSSPARSAGIGRRRRGVWARLPLRPLAPGRAGRHASCARSSWPIANEADLALVIHTREAWEDTFDHPGSGRACRSRTVFHCFTGGPEEAREAVRRARAATSRSPASSPSRTQRTLRARQPQVTPLDKIARRDRLALPRTGSLTGVSRTSRPTSPSSVEYSPTCSAIPIESFAAHHDRQRQRPVRARPVSSLRSRGHLPARRRAPPSTLSRSQDPRTCWTEHDSDSPAGPSARTSCATGGTVDKIVRLAGIGVGRPRWSRSARVLGSLTLGLLRRRNRGGRDRGRPLPACPALAESTESVGRSARRPDSIAASASTRRTCREVDLGATSSATGPWTVVANLPVQHRDVPHPRSARTAEPRLRVAGWSWCSARRGSGSCAGPGSARPTGSRRSCSGTGPTARIVGSVSSRAVFLPRPRTWSRYWSGSIAGPCRRVDVDHGATCVTWCAPRSGNDARCSGGALSGVVDRALDGVRGRSRSPRRLDRRSLASEPSGPHSSSPANGLPGRTTVGQSDPG